MALITFSRDAGDAPTALEYAEQLLKIDPTNREVTTLNEALQHQSRGTDQ